MEIWATKITRHSASFLDVQIVLYKKDKYETPIVILNKKEALELVRQINESLKDS